MAALNPVPAPDQPDTSSEAVGGVCPPASIPRTASARDALLRGLARALARGAAREAWAQACHHQPDIQETTP
jgi:hypothetical protein